MRRARGWCGLVGFTGGTAGRGFFGITQRHRGHRGCLAVRRRSGRRGFTQSRRARRMCGGLSGLTQRHRGQSGFLSVSIRVHPWFCTTPAPAGLAGAIPSSLRRGEIISAFICGHLRPPAGRQVHLRLKTTPGCRRRPLRCITRPVADPPLPWLMKMTDPECDLCALNNTIHEQVHPGPVGRHVRDRCLHQ